MSVDKSGYAILVALILWAVLVPGVRAGVAATQPATTQAAPTREQLQRALHDDAMALVALPGDGDLSDPAVRSEMGGKIIPIARHAMATIDQFPPDCRGEDMAAMKINWQPLLIVLDDPATVERVRREAEGNDETAVLARVSLAVADRILAGKDATKAEAASMRIIEEAKARPADDSAALGLLQVREDEALSPEMRAEAAALLAKSPSRVGATVRLAADMATTQPAP